MSDNCKHRNVVTFLFADNGRPAGLWACEYCGHKFVPIDLEMEKDAANCRMMRDSLIELRDRLRDHPAIQQSASVSHGLIFSCRR